MSYLLPNLRPKIYVTVPNRNLLECYQNICRYILSHPFLDCVLESQILHLATTNVKRFWQIYVKKGYDIQYQNYSKSNQEIIHLLASNKFPFDKKILPLYTFIF